MLRTHRQRVPAMLAVACVGMLVYAAAGAAPDDGQQLIPAAEMTVPVAKGDGKDAKATDDCKDTTSTTKKDGGKDTTSTTKKDGDKDTTSTTEKKGGDDKASTKAAFNTAAADKDTTSTTKKDADKDEAEKDDGKDDAGKDDAGKDEPDDCKDTTSTTKKDDGKKDDGKKDDGKDSTTTTEKDRPTTTTTRKAVEPTSPPPSGGDPGAGGGGSGAPAGPAPTPIEPQEAPPYDPSYDQPAGNPDPDAGDWYEMPEEGPVDFAEDEYAFGPGPAPGEAQPVIPALAEHKVRSGGKASATSDRSSRRRNNRDRTAGDQELAAAPPVVSSAGAVQASPGQTQSEAVSRKLGGLKSSVNESAFPADIISTPRVFPVNRRDPLAAAALVLLVGVSRELFKAWRRRVSDYWPA